MGARLVVSGALSLALGASACGSAASSPDEGPSIQRSEGREDEPGGQRVTRSDPRALPAGARFADVVASARAQDRLRDQDSEGGCLLRRRPPRLEADLSAAVRPLPEAPPSLAGRLGSVSALTRHGLIGAPDAALALVAFTTTRPPVPASGRALILTSEAIWVAPIGAGEPVRRLELAALAGLPDDGGLVLVTAEASVPLERLLDVLAALPSSLAGRLALAVALPEGTRLPEVPALEAPETAPICELAPLPDDAWGDLAVSAVREGVAPLAERARACVGGTEGPGAGGGRVTLSLRIGPEGRVVDACVSEDTSGDGALRACLVRAARELAFASPTGGSVDVAVPLRLEPGAAHRQRGVCP